MANRHLSRSVVIQSLFEWDFNGYDKRKETELEKILERNIHEFAPGLDNASFSKKLIVGILKNIKRLNKIIEKAAPEWPLSQISIVDRNILRLGLFELLFGDRKEVPPKVAINEAIELAKAFGGDSSSKFVNGVLGTVYKEIGEPDKDKTSADKELDLSKLPIERLGGAVVYAIHNDDIYLALVHNVFGFWTLPKGRVDEEKKESVENSAIREVKEETDLDVVIEKELGVNEYVARTTERGTLRKQVNYFLAKSDFTDVRLEKVDDKNFQSLNNVKWFQLPEIKDLKIYDDVLPFITKAVKILKNR